MMMPIRRFSAVLKRSVINGSGHNLPRMAAALAFYTIFSLVPLLLAVIAIAGMMIDRSRLQVQIIEQIRYLLGSLSAQTVESMMAASQQPAAGIWPGILAAVSLLWGSMGALMELQDGLDRIWNVARWEGWWSWLRHRFTTLAVISGVAFLLLVSLVVSAFLSAISTLISHQMPLQEALWHTIDFFISWGVITFLFTIIYKALPDADVSWSDTWLGAAAASLLFSGGKVFVGLYIGKSAMISTYGAAGSFVVLLIWVYYSALILYMGAEIAKAYGDEYGTSRA